MKSIAIDMDDTIADTLSRHLQWYQREFGVSLSRESIRGSKIYDVVPEEHRKAVAAFPHHEDFFKDLPVIEHAQEILERLSSDYEIFIASAAMEYPSSFEAKYQWLKQNFSFIDEKNYIFCGVKYFLNTDYLIDDSPRHLDAFNGRGILYNAESNVHATGYLRLNSWKDVEELLD